ncbi:MAG: histidine kinase [Spirochaeta sp.]|nr:histidine kinase [Spirochaeta sp.]
MKISDLQIIHSVVAVLVAALLTVGSFYAGIDGSSARAGGFTSYTLQAHFLVPVLVASTLHILIRMPLVARIPIILLRILVIQMLLVLSRESVLPTILMLLPVGIEIGMILPTGGMLFAWFGGMIIVYLFGSVDSVWNHAVATFSWPVFGVVGVFFGGGCLMGSKLRHALKRIQHATVVAERLQENMIALTQANLKFMQYAATAEARSKEEERSRITRDIHDSIGYAMTNILAMARLVVRLAADGADQIAEIAREVEGQAHEGLLQMRGAVRKLRATRNDPPKGREAILRLTRTFSLATGINVTTDFSNSAWSDRTDVDDVLYHIVQESLTNAFRHGHATEISVVFSRVEQGIRVVVEDNGEGTSFVEYGVGLAGMAERARAVGGYTRPEPIGNGFRVVGWLPL